MARHNPSSMSEDGSVSVAEPVTSDPADATARSDHASGAAQNLGSAERILQRGCRGTPRLAGADRRGRPGVLRRPSLSKQIVRRSFTLASSSFPREGANCVWRDAAPSRCTITSTPRNEQGETAFQTQSRRSWSCCFTTACDWSVIMPTTQEEKLAKQRQRNRKADQRNPKAGQKAEARLDSETNSPVARRSRSRQPLRLWKKWP